MFVGIGLFVARTMVMLSLRIVVPVMLVLLAIVFGKGLRNAARSVSEAGGRANEALGRAQSRIRVPSPSLRTERTDRPSRGARVSEPEVARTRIVDAELLDDDESDEATGGHHPSSKTRGG